MQIIKDRQLVEDNWKMLDAETSVDTLPDSNIIVTLDFWLTNKEALAKHKQKTGISLAPDEPIEKIASDLDKLALIVLQFPAFRDGRAYSQARKLRLHHHYQGEIRATGNVLRDQMAYMERVGINSLEVDEKQNATDALNAFEEISIKYQASSDEALPFYKRRSA